MKLPLSLALLSATLTAHAQGGWNLRLEGLACPGHGFGPLTPADAMYIFVPDNSLRYIHTNYTDQHFVRGHTNGPVGVSYSYVNYPELCHYHTGPWDTQLWKLQGFFSNGTNFNIYLTVDMAPGYTEASYEIEGDVNDQTQSATLELFDVVYDYHGPNQSTVPLQIILPTNSPPWIKLPLIWYPFNSVTVSQSTNTTDWTTLTNVTTDAHGIAEVNQFDAPAEQNYYRVTVTNAP